MNNSEVISVTPHHKKMDNGFLVWADVDLMIDSQRYVETVQYDKDQPVWANDAIYALYDDASIGKFLDGVLVDVDKTLNNLSIS